MTHKNFKKSASSPAFWVELCGRFPEKKLFTFWKANDSADFLTGEKLAYQIKNLGGILQQKLAPQEKAILLLPQGLDYIYSLMACFYANIIAIPTSIIGPEQKPQIEEKIYPILQDSEAALIITDNCFQEYLEENQIFSSIPRLNIQALSQNDSTNREPRPHKPEDIALLLYTSGSTSQPKGVMLSHGNTIAQASMGAAQWGVNQDSCIVSWMPQFHNFGLYMNILTPLFKGASSVILSPGHFLKNPEDWLKTIDRFQATHTAAPNFAFDYCCSSIDISRVNNLSLRSLQAIICGGEPVRKETYENFTEKFGSLGLGKNVFCPHYGMSETGTITTIKPGQPLRFLSLDIPSVERRKIKYTNQQKKSKTITSCGEIGGLIKVSIVNPDTSELCSQGEIGEIWIKAPSVGMGYLNRKQETEDSFSRIINTTKEGGFFRTGDLGFIDDNHLYIAGREKEVIIIHGKNHYPVDIEWTIKKYISGLNLPISVFSYENDGREKVVAVQEVETALPEAGYQKLIQKMLTAVSENHGLELSEINFVNKGSIPRTGSGKIQRKACRNAYLSQTLPVLYQYRHGVSNRQPWIEESVFEVNRKILERLKREVFLPVLKVDPEKFKSISSFSELGLDSIQYVRISRKIEEVFGIQFTPVMLFKHRNFEKLAEYISAQIEEPQKQSSFPVKTKTDVFMNPEEIREKDIAIIGISCHFPGGATDHGLFWENLVGQKDCITPILGNRNQIIDDYQNHYGDITDSFPLWSGFIDDIDTFDASFFGISPIEAECMDPQQRKILEITWSVIEDSGYSPHQLSGKDVGLFIGVHNNDYAELVSRQPALLEIYGAHLDTGLHMSMIANRTSRWFNFHGPSEVINTACSSSLVAIHHAVESIRRGESNLAIAGGINLILTSRIYRAGFKAGMLSKDGRCKTFDESADGFVRAEGYGAVLLKPYSQAVTDRDTIYGVIKGVAINHDGQSNSLRAPNLNTQKQLIKEAYQKSGIPPETISYIETHGSGTSLGDPIEIQALREAFLEINPGLPGNFTRERTCGLGTVKTNIGHCESASGIAGVIKVLLSMKNGILPGMLHFKRLNPFISLENSPFYIVSENREWKRLKNSEGKEIPRRAGISSFGFGGANAHVIIEEFSPLNTMESTALLADKATTVMVPISAKNKERLYDYIKKLRIFLKKSFMAQDNNPENNPRKISLPDIAYTLQVGRVAMEERVIFLVKDIPDLIQKLADYEQNKEIIENCWQNRVKQGKDFVYLLENDEDSRELIRQWISKHKFDKIAQYWIQGGKIDWDLLYDSAKPYRINLPTYSFAKESYWIPERHWIFESDTKSGNLKTRQDGIIHPLLHQNTSDLLEHRFSSIFYGDEFYIADYVTYGQRVFTGVAHLEMVRAAVIQAVTTSKEGLTGFQIKNVVWDRPIVMKDQPVQVHIGLYPEHDDEIAYQIYSKTGDTGAEGMVHSQGIVLLSPPSEASTLNLAILRERCNRSVLSSGQFYENCKMVGIAYGPAYQGVEELYMGRECALAKLSLPASVLDTQSQFVVHPILLDSALQASMGFIMGFRDSISSNSNVTLSPVQPVALQRFELYEVNSPIGWALIRFCEEGISWDMPLPGARIPQIDIDLYDINGTLCIRMKGLELQTNTGDIIPPVLEIVTANNTGFKEPEAFEIMTFEEVWQEQARLEVSPASVKTLVCFLTNSGNQQAVMEAIRSLDKQTEVIFVAQGACYQKQTRQSYRISRTDPDTFIEAFRNIREDNDEVDALLYLWELEDSSCIQDYSCIINILRAMAATKLKAKRVLLAAQFGNGIERCYLESWIGFERSLRLIFTHTPVVTICQETGTQNPKTAIKDWLRILWNELQTPKAESVLYQEGKRHTYQIKPTKLGTGETFLRTGGTYLITGGCGGIGLLFAEHFARRSTAIQPVNLILTGRSPLNAQKQSCIKKLESLGSRVFYIQADVCDLKGMKKGLNRARKLFGGIHGVIHAAGISVQQNILEKDIQSFLSVLKPKIEGTLVLDELLEQEETLDFICYFSSAAAIIGDFGWCDYAIGNRFLMAYARYRNHGRQNKRPGKAIVINWPIWKDGGMRLDDDESAKMYLKSSGQRLLEAGEGMVVFDRIMASSYIQHLILVGQPSRVHHFLGLNRNQSAIPSLVIPSSSGGSRINARGRRPEMKGWSLEQCLEWDLKELINKLLKIPRDKIDKEKNLADFGFNSISLVQFEILLIKRYGFEITPALFYKYPNLERLIRYFLTEHQAVIQEYYKEDLDTNASPEPTILPKVSMTKIPLRAKTRRTGLIGSKVPQSVLEPIAIIGMSGRFPQARNVDELWKILVSGQDVVQEIPEERFNWRQYYGDPKEPGKTNCKWCGCIPGVSEFDPLFFEISPHEAENMDPRQRLLLQESWKALEDAGYGATQIKANKIGMFVGVEQGNYHLPASGEGNITSNHDAILAARLPYFLNFKGPVMAINTACSSGLVAAHQACLSLRNGECDTAIAAGINLMLFPEAFIELSQAGMLSKDGKTYAFDERANGMVPGEGVAVVVLKRLTRAIADGDPIYGVIKGSGINYDGKTNGITAPSGESQAELLKTVYEQFMVNPETIEYIVTHGTGTKLGDPVEINALYEVFKGYTKKQHFCALTSTKTNFGHTMAASGLLSLISLIQAFRHETIPASLHCEQPSNYINWKESPFYINKSNKPWPEISGKSRIGGVSSFGMSGTNAHMVLQSYSPEQDDFSRHDQAPYYLFAFAAKTNEALQEKAKDLIEVLEDREWRAELSQISYTLLEGRHHFNHRCAIVIQDREDAISVLRRMRNKEKLPNLFLGKVPQDFTNQKMMQQYVLDLVIRSRSLTDNRGQYQEILCTLAALYCQGYNIPWDQRYQDHKPRRINLPAYPFAREIYRVSAVQSKDAGNIEEKSANRLKAEAAPSVTSIEPLIGTNILTPVWDVVPVRKEKDRLFPLQTGQVAIIGGDQRNWVAIKQYYPDARVLMIDSKDTIEIIAKKLEAHGTFDHLFWIGPDQTVQSMADDNLIEQQDQGVFQVFRIIKALILLGYDNRTLGWSLITTQTQSIGRNERVNPAHASIHGLIGSMAKEYSNWKVRLIDVESGCEWPVGDLLALPSDPMGNEWVYRNRQWYRRQLVPIHYPPLKRTGYRTAGTYVVIGGAGGVGEAWSEYVVRTYQAQVVWIGRREINAAIQAKLDRIAAYGPRPFYIAADSTDKRALQQAYQVIKERYSQIHGVIHSAIVLLDRSLGNMEEEQFKAALAAKVDISVRIAQVFGNEPLDFVMFFSAFNSFLKSPGQSNYVSGCTFKDAFARQLALEWPCAVKVINWGYWGNIGIVASKVNRERMAGAGIGSIEPPEAMEALEALLAGPVNQIALIKTIRPVTIEGINAQELITIYPENPVSKIRNSSGNPFEQMTLSRNLNPSVANTIQEFTSTFERILTKLLWVQLRSMGLFTQPKVAIADLKAKIGLRDLYEKWLDESINILVRQNYLQYEGEELHLGVNSTPADIDATWKEWEQKRNIWLEDPNWKAQVILVETTMRALPDILNGKRPATEVIFPNSSMELVEGVYKNNPSADYFNEILAGVLVAYLDDRLKQDSSSQFRIIEIGAGTGGTSSVVFQKIKPYQEHIREYCYTDISKAFLFHAEKKYGPENPYLNYQIFDVGLPLAGQGISAGEYDIAIATNVLHATQNIRQTLRNTKAILKSNGLVLLNEINGNSLFTHLTFGLLEGWWLYEDQELRIPGCPGLNSKTWQMVLESEGFEPVFFPAETAHHLGQQIIIAESDGVVRQKQACPVSRQQPQSLKSNGYLSGMDVTDPMIEDYIRETIIEKFSESLKIAAKNIETDSLFSEYGVDSITGIRLVQIINQTLMIELKTTDLFDYSTVNQLSKYISTRFKEQITNILRQNGKSIDSEEVLIPHSTESAYYTPEQLPDSGSFISLDSRKSGESSAGSTNKDPIAIIGMSGRFAKSRNVNELWEHLANGTDLVEKVSRWDLSKLCSADIGSCIYGSFLEDIDRFDPLFFNISGLEAAFMDPQQRLFLEESWKALEDAGYAGTGIRGRQCGVYVGYNGGDYRHLIAKCPDPPAQAMWGNAGAIVPARIAYYLNLNGPAITIDTACSSSLVAVHLACQGLRTGEIELALAGGVSVHSTPEFYLAAGRAGMLSSTGRCYTFDERADGFVPGEGVGVIILKRLQDAIADGDHIYGVIRGSGINQDGATNGITAPSANSQERLERYVYNTFKIDPAGIQMVEAHGTGTKLGDPIEFEALTRAFRNFTDKKEYCAIGSIKTNLGHTTAAAGIAGLIKILLSLKHRKIAPSIHFESGNSNIRFEESPFYINVSLRDWDVAPNEKRCAAISAFGFSGTNAHMVIEEAPNLERVHSRKPGYLICLSARTSEQLRLQVRQLVEYCMRESDIDCGNMSYTLILGRKHFNHRLACIVRDQQELVALFTKWLDRGQASQIHVSEIHENNHREQRSLKKYGNQCIHNCVNYHQANDYLEQLAAIADLYVQGYDLEYEQLFANEQYSRMALPTYPFDRERYWVPETKPRDIDGFTGPITVGLSQSDDIVNREISPVSPKTPVRATLLFKPDWQEQKAIHTGETTIDYDRHLVILCELNEVSPKSIEIQFTGISRDCRCLAIPSEQKNTKERFQTYVLRVFEEIQIILKDKPKSQVLIQIVVPLNNEGQLFAGISGLLKTAKLENPKVIGQLIEVESGANSQEIISILKENWYHPEDCWIEYHEGKPMVAGWSKVDISGKETRKPWRDSGIYMITGGAGGLGLIFAGEIARQVKGATLILTGRSPLNLNKKELLKRLETTGARIIYQQADVSREQEVNCLIQSIRKEFGGLHGIIHSAGIIRDNFIINKTKDEFLEVMAPKVSGLWNLDEATKEMKLDFFVCFSAGAGAMGNPGQADYSTANAFMDCYARYRNHLVSLKKRHGRTLAINWPYWKEGGMCPDKATEKIWESMGFHPMETQAGIHAFYQCFSSGLDQVLVMEGDISAIENYLLETMPYTSFQPVESTKNQVNPEALGEKTRYLLRRLFGEIIHVDTDRIDIEEPLESYGIDSIIVTRMNHELAGIFGNELPKTLFFEYRTLGAIAEYLLTCYSKACLKWARLDDQTETNPIVPEAGKCFGQGLPIMTSAESSRTAMHNINPPFMALPVAFENQVREPIAIIGMSGSYPKAPTLNDYWRNLLAGKNCITEIPKERWPLQGFYHPDQQKAVSQGKSYSKWGGFVEGFAEFDPLFFNISPLEAFNMDPQERLFIKSCWELLEDAGYTKKQIIEQYHGKVGVFAGITKTGFDLYGPYIWRQGESIYPHTSFSSVANRVSYLLDLKGPSVPVDTMCSSSLTAIHEACEYLYRGECEMAIAGGVNLYLHPSSYIALCRQQMLSSDGRCRSFGQGGNGFVPGEGVGVILLKLLSRAVADEDHIYAIIRGTGINHGGKTNGYMVPNPKAQEELIRAVLDKARINARTVSYIEAHGTGTELGDPIEITGLTRAFRKDTEDTEFCAIGSVKSNIGHLEAAAGIAGLTKVVLQMKHRQLTPSLHAAELNPNIDFKNSPFVVQRNLAEWKRPIATIDGVTKEYPRIAGISSFGAGGANAHVVIEEYIPKEQPRIQTSVSWNSKVPVIIVLSAKSEERLKEKARQLLDAIGEEQFTDADLANIAYTLQVGREAMEERLGIIASSMAELGEKLREFIEDRESVGNNLYRGQVKRNQETLAIFNADEDMAKTIEIWIAKGKYGKLVDLWVKGLVIDWNKLYGDIKPQRISLPFYPFAKETYWIQERYRLIEMGTSPGSSAATLKTSLPDVLDIETQKACQLMTFEEVWQEQALPDTVSVRMKTLICFLSHPENQQTIIETMESIDQQTKIVFISQSKMYQKLNQWNYKISRTGKDKYEEAFRSIREDFGDVDGILYLWPFEDSSCMEDYSCMIYILQAISTIKLKVKRVLFSAQYKNELERCYLESWIGFERSLGLVLPNTGVAVIYQEETEPNRKILMGDWFRKLWAELNAFKSQSVLYQDGKRYLCRIRPITLLSDDCNNSLLKAGGTYLITGGCGGLGLLFAEYIAGKHPVNLVLTGRSLISDIKQMKIKALEEMGSQVMYLQADICDLKAMKLGLERVKERFGKINGVIHAAGVESRRNIFQKEIDGFQTVLNPKIKGTLILDEILGQEPLDFICYFSSSSAILGDFGSCDYSIANRFLMSYAHYRNQLRIKGKCQGKAVVVNWPLWKDGGMGFSDNEETRMYLKSSGQNFLINEDGFAVFERILSQNNTQYLVLVGQPGRVYRFLGLTQEQPASLSLKTSSSSEETHVHARGRRSEMKGFNIKQCLEWDLKEYISNLLKIPRNKIDLDGNLADYGFDSISLAQFASLLSSHFGIEITPALFFGYSTLEKLIQYFLKAHRNAIQEFYGEDTGMLECEEQVNSEKIPVVPILLNRQRPRGKRFMVKKTLPNIFEPIAIIGMSGRFPGARNIDELWAILVAGQDMVQEIPPERFDWRRYYGNPNLEQEKTNCKWGGFIPGVSEFDPLFFDISPREAETMDPRQRLLLQESWKALEDAGYGTKQIRASKIGMFVGVEQGDYQLLAKGKNSITSNNNAILASRLAYFLNLNGPVISIDTACSSGLVAVHQAILSLQCEECDTAITAGVNLLFTPELFIRMSQAGMLSEDGKCFAFDKRANGIVPGEAVAVVVLKRLSRAVADRDPIYAVIKGSGINYDGKTNGITAPSGVAQTNLLKSVYDRYRINPEEIEYVITHGTGTKLGDPVEINALYDAFKHYTTKKGYCALTSTKTNFGHSFAASGLVSLISLVQALRHEIIPASLHCEQVNDYINWQESPFYINKANRTWPQKKGKTRIESTCTGVGVTRMGAVSAFGMSGTNAHIVVQSYSGEEDSACRQAAQVQAPYYLLAFSAKTERALQEKIMEMITVLENKDLEEYDLTRLSYTLLEGRQHFNHRCAIVVQDQDDAIYLLKQVARKEKLPNLFWGKVPRNFTGQKLIGQYAQDLLKQSQFLKENKTRYQEMLYTLAELYCQGYEFEWNQLYGDIKPHRIHLPTYPFGRESYWIEEDGNAESNTESGSMKSKIDTFGFIHPLLHQNTSDFSEQRYSSTFTGREFFLADHIVKNKRVLPGVVSLEIVRAAVEAAAGSAISVGRAEGRTGIRFKDIAWVRPVVVEDQPVPLHVGLVPEENGKINYKIYGTSYARNESEKDEARIIYTQGSVESFGFMEAPTLDLLTLQARCTKGTLSSTKCYEVFRTMGIDYGPGLQGIEQLYIGLNHVLAKLSLPSSILDTQEQYILHPSLMDSALQASIGFMAGTGDAGGNQIPNKSMLPFAIQEIEIFGKCTPAMWALIQPSDGNEMGDNAYGCSGIQKLDIDLSNETGTICVRMKGFSSRVLEGEIQGNNGPNVDLSRNSGESSAQPIMMAPVWDEVTIEKNQPFLSASDTVVIAGGTPDIRNTIQEYYPKTCILEIHTTDTIDDLAKKIKVYGIIDHFIWIAQHNQLISLADEALIEEQGQGVLQVFRIIKALLHLGYGTRNLKWSVITIQTQSIRKNDTVNPTHAGLHGLTGSLAKEFPNWKIRVVDLEASWFSGEERLFDAIFTLPADPQGNCLAYRGGKWYRQQLLPYHCLSLGHSLYRTGGVYVVIGGAGGIGEVWSEYMIRTYQAQTIWIGRRQKDTAIQAKLDRLAALGPAPLYIMADATDQKALQQAYETIKKCYRQIHGVIHAAVVLADQSLVKMEETQFKAALAAKVNVSVRMTQVFGKEPLDFIMFFSSLQSFTKAAGQSNYAAGCTFNDAFAHQLALEYSCAVKVMNWGYWGSVGIVAHETYRNRMAHAGIGSIEPQEAMEALEILLSGPMNQIAFLKTSKLLEGINQTDELIMVQSQDTPSNIEKIIKNNIIPTSFTGVFPVTDSPMGINIGLRKRVEEDLLETLSQLLDINTEDIDTGTNIDEYGIDPVLRNQFAAILSQKYKLELASGTFLEYQTLYSLAEYLVETYSDVLAKYFQI